MKRQTSGSLRLTRRLTGAVPALKKLSLLTLAACLTLACPPEPTPPPGPDDTTPPQVSLTAAGSVLFSTDEGPAAPLDACAEVRQFPATIVVSSVDDVGVATVTVSVFPGEISDASAAPDTADLSQRRERETDILTVTTRSPAGSVQPNVLVTLDVSERSAILASATDTSGNRATLYQVDVRPQGSPLICRGE